MVFIKKNVATIIFIIFLILIVFVPNTKAFFLRSLMEIGFFSPANEGNVNAKKINLGGIEFKDTNGKIVDLGSLEGKVIFINFWATWCPPCIAEMPSLNKLYNQFKEDKNIVFLFVDADGDFANSSAFLKKRAYQMPLYKMEANIPDQLFSGSLPTTIILDKKGRLSFKHEGLANYADKKFADFIEKLKVSNL